MKLNATTIALFCASALSIQAATYVDTTFNNSDWSVQFSTDVPGSTASFNQLVSGGNPGSAQSENYTLLGSGRVRAEFLRAGAFYDPSVQGAIASVDFSLDVLVTDTSQPFVSVGILIFQGGKFYRYAAFQPNPYAVNTWYTLGASGIPSGGLCGDRGGVNLNLGHQPSRFFRFRRSHAVRHYEWLHQQWFKSFLIAAGR